ncbi:MAG: putative nucleotidyltransferase with HDIG domain [Myxococcota bacterium]
MIAEQDIVDALEEGVELPSIPKAVVRLLSVMADPDHSRCQVSDIVRTEPGLVADALRMANSGAIRQCVEPVESVDEALSVLGEAWLLRTVVARGMRTISLETLEGYGMDVDALWEHSVRVALLAEALAARANVSAPIAYTAGLLVDVGKLVASGALTGLGRRVQDTLESRQELTFDAVERLLLGIDHAELGARVAQAWDLPPSLVDALRFHHRPQDACSNRDLVQVIHVADTLAYLTGRGLGVDGMLYRVMDQPLPSLVLDRSDVDTLLLSVELKVQQLEALIND